MGQAFFFVGAAKLLSGSHEFPVQTDIGRGGADQNPVAPALFEKAVRHAVKDPETLIVKGNAYFLLLSHLQKDLGKALQFFFRPEDLALRGTDIELRNLRPRPAAGIPKSEADPRFADSQLLISKTRIRKAEAERIAKRHLRLVVIAIADINALAVLRTVAAQFPVGISRCVRKRTRIALGEFAGGVRIAVEEFRHRAGARLTAEVAVQDGSYCGDRCEIHDRTRAQHEDKVRIHGRKRAERSLLRCREREGLSIQALGLRHLIEPAAKNHAVRAAREPQGLTEPSRFLSLGVVSVPRIAARIADQFLPEAL